MEVHREVDSSRIVAKISWKQMRDILTGIEQILNPVLKGVDKDLLLQSIEADRDKIFLHCFRPDPDSDDWMNCIEVRIGPGGMEGDQ